MASTSVLLQVKKFFSDINSLLLFLLLLVPFIYVDSMFDKVNLPRFAYVALIASIWLITWLIHSNKKKISLNWNPLFLIIIFILFLASVSYLWGKENMMYQAELYFYISLVIICFLSMQLSPNTIFKFSFALTITATVCAIIGILQNFGFNPIDYDQIAPPAATFINKNFAGNYFELVLPISIALLIFSKDKNEVWVLACAVSLIASYIILTNSRGAYLSTFISLSLFFLLIQFFPFLKKQVTLISNLYKKQLLIIIITPFLLASLPSNYDRSVINESRYADLFAGTQQNSISSRFNASRNSFDLFKEQPLLGVGLGGFQQNFRPYLQSRLAKNKIFSDFIYLHNEPLQLVVELGIIGGVAALLFFIFLFKFSFLSLKYEAEIKSDITVNRIKTLHIGFLIAITTSLSHSLFSFPYHQATSATFMALLVGFTLNLSGGKISFANVKKLKIVRVLILASSLILLLGVSHFYYKYIESSIYMKQSITQENCNKASDFAIQSNNSYAKDYLSQSQGINIIALCPNDTKVQLLFAEKILKNNPTHPWALYLYAISSFKLDDYNSSYKALKSLSFLYPNFSGAYTLIGHIAVKKKDYSKAKSYYKHALKLAPNNSEAKDVLRQLSKKGY